MSDVAETVIDTSVWDALRASGKSPAPDSPLAYGFWRLVNKAGGYAIPICSWSEENFWLVSIGGQDPIDKDCGEEWTGFLAKTWPKLQAVEYADYGTAIDTGVWPNGMPASKDRLGIGGNNPPEDLEPHQAIAKKVSDLETTVKAWLEEIGGKPETKAQADQVVQHRDAFLALEKEAEKARIDEKEPHLAASRAVDAKWQPIVRDAAALKKQLVDMGQAFIRAEQARLAEEARKERERLAEIEARRAAEAAAAGEPAPEPTPPPPSEPEPPKVTIGTGRQMGAHKAPLQIEITDLEAWAGYLGKINAAGVAVLAEKLAHQMAKVGVPHMPGVLVDGKPRLNPNT